VLLGGLVALGLAALAIVLTPAPWDTPQATLAGLPRLVVYFAAGLVLALTALRAASPMAKADSGNPEHQRWQAYVLLGLGGTASLGISTIVTIRLLGDLADPLGPPLWIASMLVLLGYTLLPQVRRLGWPDLWWGAARGESSPWGLRLGLLITILGAAALVRLLGLATLPMGINPDEGDRASSALNVLTGEAPVSWFDSGWYFINMVYFRLLAASMAIFGTDVAGGRTLSAMCGIGFVASVAWAGCCTFGWRTGLVATMLAASCGAALQQGRVITESAVTALLWGISLAGFLEAARAGRPWAWAIAGLSGGLGLYFYPSSRLWAVGAVLSVVVIGLQCAQGRWRELASGIAVAAIASVVAAAPFLVHLAENPAEMSLRFEQTSVLNPDNQIRLLYLQPPEALPRLLLLQAERTLGAFDRYSDGGGFLVTGRPLFPQPLAALTLISLAYALVRGASDPRLALLTVWFWLGLSGMFLTVETPNLIRSAGMLPSLFPILAVLIEDLVDRLYAAVLVLRRAPVRLPAGALSVALVLLIAGEEVTAYTATFSSMPVSWGPMNREGLEVAALGASGPVYSLEIDEHLVMSGWVRLLAPRAVRGRIPNPGRELPLLAPLLPTPASRLRPETLPTNDQRLNLILSENPNQATYEDLLRRLYPGGTLERVEDGRRAFVVAADALAATRGVRVSGAGQTPFVADTFGQVPPEANLPARLTWSAGVLMPRSDLIRFQVSAPGAARLSLDRVTVLDSPASQATGAATDVELARGLHYLELSADVGASGDRVMLTRLVEAGSSGARELQPAETYRLMDAPWGLLAELKRPIIQRPSGPVSADVSLDTTVGMAFFEPELQEVGSDSTVVWSGSLLVESGGLHRMVFAAEDPMTLELDGQPVGVPTFPPDAWARADLGAVVPLTAGLHTVRVTLQVTHGGRDLARWNWVPPRTDGSLDAASAWTVVPPMVLRPAPGVRLRLPL
jgi:hypothetical protein